MKTPDRMPASNRRPGMPPRWMRLLLDLPFVGVVVCGARDRNCVAANDRLCAMLGYGRGELARMDWRDLCHPAERARAEAAFQRLLSRRAPHVRILMHLLRKDGGVLPMDVDLSFARPRGARSLHVIALVAEPLQGKVAAAPERTPGAPGDAEEKLNALVEQSISGIYIMEGGRLSYANPRMAEIFGYAPEALTGMPAMDLVAPQDRDLVAENIRRRLSGEAGSLRYEFHGLRRDGGVILVGAHGRAAMIGGRRAIVGALQDITERKLAETRAFEHARRMEAAMQATVESITRIVELRDPYTAGHEHRVASLAEPIGRGLALEDDRIRGLAVAGRLHDIGKIGVPAEILVKPARLSAAEFDLVRDHCGHGHGILGVVDFPWPVAELAWQHHERVDGSGYPRGLKGKEILPEARILAVADVIEAMSSHRPYRAALGIEPALIEIESGAGTRYDADVAAGALRLCRDKGFRLPV